jgi:uncharacterized membrane protein HdeD (DUF308 family)
MLAARAREEVGTGIASRWGWLVFRGVIGVLFGLIAFARPGAMALSMVLVFGVFAFISGIATIIAAARSGHAGESWGTLLLEGLLAIAVGVLAVLWPARMALTFVWLIGFWAIFSGVLEIASAVRMRKVIDHEWALGIAGVLSIAFGLLMFYRPVAGGVAVVWWLGAYVLLMGVLMIVLGFRLRSFGKRLERGGGYPQEVRQRA